MNVLKEVFKKEVYPALGCTEPISIAYAASMASRHINDEITLFLCIVDQGTYKNGFGVAVPNTGGRKGNLIAGILGAMIRKPELKMEVLEACTPDLVEKAEQFIRKRKPKLVLDLTRKDIYIDVTVVSPGHSGHCILQGSHTRVVFLERDGTVELDKTRKAGKEKSRYKKILKKLSLENIIDLAMQADKEDLAYLEEGINMNLRASQEGLKLQKVGYYLTELNEKGMMGDKVFASTGILTAGAADARMAGLPLPVMASGESGNQGIVATLVPHNVGLLSGVKKKTILQSIALSHLLNAYVKVFTGGLAPICGCAIAAGVGAAAALVFQKKGRDIKAITLAINNLISDLGGMLCDGAKGGCALKVASSTDSAIRSAYMAMNYYGISEVEGFVGKTAEETIQNLGKISGVGMERVDDTIVKIMMDKENTKR